MDIKAPSPSFLKQEFDCDETAPAKRNIVKCNTKKIPELMTMESEESSLSEDCISGEEEEFDPKQHARLLNDLTATAGVSHVKNLPERQEFTQMSEHHSSSNTKQVKLFQLLGALKDKSHNRHIRKQVNRANKLQEILPAPLPKFHQEKIHRTQAYETVTTDISRWDPIVQKNREAEQLQFPLVQADLRVLTTVDDLRKKMKPRSSLEQEVAELLGNSETQISETTFLTPLEEKALLAMSMEEAEERRAELQKYRALTSYQHAKARRERKIKSKSFHRVKRKAELKAEKKLLESLEKNDPEAFIDKLRKYDEDRIRERHTLKHRGGSKFAKRQMIYKKYDDRARQDIQEMLQKSRELTKKVAVADDSGDDEVEGEPPVPQDKDNEETNEESSNPWMTAGIKIKKNEIGHYRKPEAVQNTEIIQDDSGDTASQTVEVTSMKQAVLDSVNIDKLFDKLETKSKKPERRIGEKRKREIEKLKNVATVREMKNKRVKKENKRVTTENNIVKTENKRVKKENKRVTNKNKRVKKDDDDENIKGKASIDEESKDIKHDDESSDEEDEDNFAGIKMSLKRKSKMEDFENQKEDEHDKAIDNVIDDTTDDLVDESQTNDDLVNNSHTNDDLFYKSHKKAKLTKHDSSSEDTKSKNKQKNAAISVDPTKFMTLGADLSSVELVHDEDVNDFDARELTISEAFADDDVVKEFMEEKRKVEDEEIVKDLDLTLPGWGAWGGAGLKKTNQKRIIVKAPQLKARKDKGLNNVIISRKQEKSIEKHQVINYPKNYVTKAIFERSMKQPIGKTWVPEMVHSELTKPKTVIQIGSIIAPISKSRFTKQKVKQGEIRFHDKEEKGMKRLNDGKGPSTKRNQRSNKHGTQDTRKSRGKQHGRKSSRKPSNR